MFASLKRSSLLRLMFYHRLYSNSKAKPVTDVAIVPEHMPFRQRLFTGMQPSGNMHLGNYLGVVKKWTELQHTKDDAVLCIADLHAITTAKDPPTLRENIFRMAAALLACGVDLEHTTLFVQSAVKEHAELCWILSSISSMNSLGHQPKYMANTRLSKKVSLGIFVYPVLQASDVLLYKSTHVPIGDDQMTHLEYAQDMAAGFNSYFDKTFPVIKPIKADYTGRVCCLKDPTKKMSKSNSDPKSTIYITDEPDDILRKMKDTVTDFSSDVSYEPEKRVGISNLIGIHANIAGKTPDEIVVEAQNLGVIKYKNLVADIIIEHLNPIRQKYLDLIGRRNELIYQLDAGAAKARVMAAETMDDVKQRMGLGVSATPPRPILAKAAEEGIGDFTMERRKTQAYMPVVPKQLLREEKQGYQGLSSLVRKQLKTGTY